MGKEIIKINFHRDDGQNLMTATNYEAGDIMKLFGITEVTGLEFPEIEVFTENKGLGDGAFITGKRLAARTIEVHIKALAEDLVTFTTARGTLAGFFRPSHTFTLEVSRLNFGAGNAETWVTRELQDCELIAASWPTVQTAEWNPEVVLQFLALDPLFKSLTASQYTTTSTTGATTRTVTNNGEHWSWPTIRLDCTTAGAGIDGSTWTLEVRLNGHAVKTINPLDYTWHVGDYIVITPENNIREINGSMSYFFDEADPIGLNKAWRLQPGANTLVVKSTKATFAVTVTWREEFIDG